MKITKSYDPDRRRVEIMVWPDNGRGPSSFGTDYDDTGWAGIEFANQVASSLADAFGTEVVEVEPPEEW